MKISWDTSLPVLVSQPTQHGLTMPPTKSYKNKLTDLLVYQSQNKLFYEGKTTEGSKALTKEVATVLQADRVSVWLYTKNKNSIECEQMYVRSDNKFEQGAELEVRNYLPYFHALSVDTIIVADDVESHPATSCLFKDYLSVLGIKSMLDVPITYHRNILGVICIESCVPRSWTKEEINFAQLLAPLYSMAHSVKEGIALEKKLLEVEGLLEQNELVDQATLMSKADAEGKITYANKKFVDVSGWRLSELVGKDHSIVSSGMHTEEFWEEMYNTTVHDGEVWHAVVTNRSKNGKLYYVDTYIKAHFNPTTGKLTGYSSVRQDVTQIVESMKEINKKNSYLEHAAKILRHDMHSGINTYIPRGVTSLERRLPKDVIEKYKLESPIKLLKEGLTHTQRVYRGVKEFTNLVREDKALEMAPCDLRKILMDYLNLIAYKDQVFVDQLVTAKVNEPLFCTAIDNLIRNGLKYNDSPTKTVRIFMFDEETLAIQDNGRGMSQEDFMKLSQPYIRRTGQKETGTGLGLSICVAILNEHGFSISCEKLEQGTLLKVRLKC